MVQSSGLNEKWAWKRCFVLGFPLNFNGKIHFTIKIIC